MSKPSPAEQPDPMVAVVDRLLAQLPGLRGEPRFSPQSGPHPAVGPAGDAGSRARTSPPSYPPAADLLGLWGRVLLGLALGVGMGAWPYLRACGFPLVAYLVGVATVLLTGGWTAVLAWRLRNPVAHVLSLILVFWGFVLAGAEWLPRTGYAAERATWFCTPPPAWVVWLGQRF